MPICSSHSSWNGLLITDSYIRGERDINNHGEERTVTVDPKESNTPSEVSQDTTYVGGKCTSAGAWVTSANSLRNKSNLTF